MAASVNMPGTRYKPEDNVQVCTFIQPMHRQAEHRQDRIVTHHRAQQQPAGANSAGSVGADIKMILVPTLRCCPTRVPLEP